MLPGLPPRDKSFKGWLIPLVLPIAGATFLIDLLLVLSCVFAHGSVTVNGGTHSGPSAVARIVISAPMFFALFLLLATTVCWATSQRERRRDK